MNNRRNFIKATALSVGLASAGLLSFAANAADTIKVGVLHSLSGTMAISETALKETALMTIAEINNWSRWSLFRLPTGRCLLRRRASC